MATGAGETGNEYLRRVDDTIKHGLVTMGLSIGVELRLFEAMSRLDTSFTVQQLADLTNTKASMLQQWLLLMASADIVNIVDNAGHEFILPSSHRDALTSPFSRTVSSAKYVVAFAASSTHLASCFRNDHESKGDNVCYQRMYDYWHADRSSVLSALMPRVIDQIHGLSDVLNNGGVVLDVGCNKGDLAFLLSELFPKATIFGIDVSSEAVDLAKQCAVKRKSNITFQVGDAMNLPADWTGRFDYIITINSLHYFHDPEKGCREMHRVLSASGSTSVIEIKNDADLEKRLKQPGSSMFYAFNLVVASTSTDAGKGDQPAGGEAGQADEKSLGVDSHRTGTISRYLPHTETHLQTLRDAGFSVVEAKDIPQADFLDQVHIVAAK